MTTRGVKQQLQSIFSRYLRLFIWLTVMHLSSKDELSATCLRPLSNSLFVYHNNMLHTLRTTLSLHFGIADVGDVNMQNLKHYDHVNRP